MKLAEDIIIVVRGEEIELRPSLRNAFRLFRTHKPADLSKAVQEGSLTAILDIVGPFTGTDQFIKAAIFDNLSALKFPCLLFIAAAMGLEVDSKPAPVTAKTRTPVEPEQTLKELYRIATGWLSWSPDVALDSTPAEIVEAHKGRVEMLQALFGGGKQKPANKNAMSLEDKFRMAVAGFEVVKVTAP